MPAQHPTFDLYGRDQCMMCGTVGCDMMLCGDEISVTNTYTHMSTFEDFLAIKKDY